MISLSLGHLIFGYGTGLAAFLLFLWLSREVFRARRERRKKLRVIQCAICGSRYEDGTDAPLPACPQCGRPNERLSPPVV